MNAGKYTKKIKIVFIDNNTDADGFSSDFDPKIVGTFYAEVKTTKGYTLIKNDSDFEKAYTNFTIRFPKVDISRDMLVLYNEKYYSIEYLNNINEGNIELEIQAKVVVS